MFIVTSPTSNNNLEGEYILQDSDTIEPSNMDISVESDIEV